jgi:hypothetical protein
MFRKERRQPIQEPDSAAERECMLRDELRIAVPQAISKVSDAIDDYLASHNLGAIFYGDFEELKSQFEGTHLKVVCDFIDQVRKFFIDEFQKKIDFSDRKKFVSEIQAYLNFVNSRISSGSLAALPKNMIESFRGRNSNELNRFKKIVLDFLEKANYVS